MSILLSCENLAKSYRFFLFEGITLHIHEGEQIGLIGPNGKGKSTLLRIFAGKETPDQGTLTMSKDCHCGFVEQEDLFPSGMTVRQILENSLSDLSWEDHAKNTEVEITLSRLGFEDFNQKVDTLSGGWKKRLSLGRQLVRKPNLLLLDEPTNHLDLEAILWLENFLSKAPFSYILVSHDRYFLEKVANTIIELNPQYPQGYFKVKGNYSQYLEKKAEFLEQQERLELSLASKVRREIEWLKQGIRCRGTRANFRYNQAQTLISELEEVKKRNATEEMGKVDFTSTARKSKKLLEAKNLSCERGGKKLFKGVNFILSPGTRLGILGPNGSGKSSLLEVLLEKLSLPSGEVRKIEGVQIKALDQDRSALDKKQELKYALSPEGNQVIYRGRPYHITGWAKRFYFTETQLGLEVGALSGGEQARILISQMILQPADILILDEPTNDLDIPTLETLEESLNEFPGAVVLVTHDRYFLDRVCTEILALDGEGKAYSLASYSQWENLQEEKKKEKKEREKKELSKKTPPPPLPPQKSKGLSFKEKREWDSLEENILEGEALVQKWEKITQDPKVMGQYQKLQEACEELKKAQAEVDRLYSRWEELERKQKN